MVAAWIRAETGVGPSMASGSHTYSGNWADLPNAPTISSSGMVWAMAGISEKSPTLAAATYAWSLASANRAAYSTVPKCTNVRYTPRARPRSPIRLTMKAFLAAATALGFL